MVNSFKTIEDIKNYVDSNNINLNTEVRVGLRRSIISDIDLLRIRKPNLDKFTSRYGRCKYDYYKKQAEHYKRNDTSIFEVSEIDSWDENKEYFDKRYDYILTVGDLLKNAEDSKNLCFSLIYAGLRRETTHYVDGYIYDGVKLILSIALL